MQKVKVVTHSGCDLSFREAEKEGILMVPDIVIFGQEQLRNNIDILPREFYRRLEQDILPTSSHPSPGDFMNAYRKAGDCRDIICITATSQMTGTMSTAQLAADLMEDEGFAPRIHVFDSRQISFGQAIPVLTAARMAREGKDAEEILRTLTELVPRIGVYFVMDSLKYARKGGRLGAIKAITADALGVKPLLVFGHGTVSDISVNLSFQSGLNSILKMYRNYYDGQSEVYIFHAGNEEKARQLQQAILAETPHARTKIAWVGPVVGIYTGTGCVGIAFVKGSV